MAKEQLDLFVPYARRSDTSKAAAASIRGDAARIRQKVLDAIRGAGARGMTCDEVEVATGLTHQTASARVHELMRLERICDGGRRPTRSKRLATVWRARDV
jgi:uncharacterized protein (UPF0264 family)